MATLIINDEVRREQYIASAGQTVFAYTFEIFEESDLKVYKILAGQQADPDPNNDLLTLNVDYTVTNAGLTNGGDVILTVGAALNDQIIIDGTQTPIERLSDFTDGGSFGPDAVNDEFDRQTVFNQQAETIQQYRGLTYNANLLFDGNRKDNIIPILDTPSAGQFSFWAKDSNGDIISRTFEENPDASTLRNDLASQTNGSDGASLVGYFDPATNSGKTVATKLTDLQGQIEDNNIIIGGNFSTNPWQRGTNFPDIWTATGSTKAYAADRFYITKRAGNVTSLYDVSKSSNAPTVAQAGVFTNASFRAEVNTGQSPGSITADDFWFIGHNIEGYDWQKLAERDFIVHFWARTNLPGVYSFSVRNSGLDRSYTTPFTITSANVWQHIVLKIAPSPSAGTWDFTNGIGALYAWGLGGGTTVTNSTDNSWVAGDFVLASTHNVDHYETAGNYFEVDLIKTEAGLIETTYTEPQLGQIITNSQRFYEKSYNIFDDPGTVTDAGAVIYFKVKNVVGHAEAMRLFSTSKRAAPSMTWYNPTTGNSGSVRNATAATDLTVNAIVNPGTDSTGFFDTSVAPAALDRIRAHFVADAEL